MQQLKYIAIGIKSYVTIKMRCWNTVHKKVMIQLDGCILWNAHNIVFGSKSSAICAQAVYFLHSTRPSVTWLNSRWGLAAGN